MPAGGKSTVVKEFLFSTNHLGLKFGYVPGDTVAHLFFDCQYTSEELDLKYINMENIIQQLACYCDVILIEDFFKRDEDINKILKCCQEIALLRTYSLICDYETAKKRNFYREKEQFIPVERFEMYYQRYQTLNILGNIKLDSSHLSVQEISNILSDDLNRHHNKRLPLREPFVMVTI